MKRLLLVFVCISTFLSFGHSQSPIAGRYTDTAEFWHCGQKSNVPVTLTLQNEPGSEQVTGQLLLVNRGRIEQADFEGTFTGYGFLTGIAYVESGDYLLRINLGLAEGRLEGYFGTLRFQMCNEGQSTEHRRADSYSVKLERE